MTCCGRGEDKNIVFLPRQGLKEIPQDIFKRLKLRQLDMSENVIQDLPQAIRVFKLLEVLNLSHNDRLKEISAIGNLISLKRLDLSFCNIKILPDVFDNLKQLEFLILQNNQLKELPPSIGSCQNLVELNMLKNPILDFPQELCKCKLLQIVTFSQADCTNFTFRNLCPNHLQIEARTRFLLSFLEFRMKTNLPHRFQKRGNEPRPYFADHYMERTMWTDPRYFMFIRTLPYEDRVRFAMSEDPFAYPVTAPPQSELKKKPWVKVGRDGNISPEIVFHNNIQCEGPNCTNRTTEACSYHYCTGCCRNEKCLYHSQLKKQYNQTDQDQNNDRIGSKTTEANRGSLKIPDIKTLSKELSIQIDKDNNSSSKVKYSQTSVNQSPSSKTALLQSPFAAAPTFYAAGPRSEPIKAASTQSQLTSRSVAGSGGQVGSAPSGHSHLDKKDKDKEKEKEKEKDKEKDKKREEKSLHKSHRKHPHSSRGRASSPSSSTPEPVGYSVSFHTSSNIQSPSTASLNTITNPSFALQPPPTPAPPYAQNTGSNTGQDQQQVPYTIINPQGQTGGATVAQSNNNVQYNQQMNLQTGQFQTQSFTSLTDTSRDGQQTAINPLGQTPLYDPNFIFIDPKLPFSTRADMLRTYLTKLRPDEPEKWSEKPRMRIQIRRTSLLEDSFSAFMNISLDKLLLRPNVQFTGEEGIDYSGLTREWFVLIMPEITNPNYALFNGGRDTDRYVYHINPLSSVNPDHLQYFRFVGRVLGKALFEAQLVNVHFSHLIYKCLLSQPFVLSDLEPVDAELYRSLIYVSENDPKDLQLDFTMDIEEFDQVRTVELKPGGKDILVTSENKREYIHLMIEHKLTFNIHAQMKAMQKGFRDIIPEFCLRSFTPAELELLLCGVSRIDIKDWKLNTEYTGGYSINSLQIVWFWEIIDAMRKEERAKMLQFVTGTTMLPTGGFSKLIGSSGPRKFTIYKSAKPLDYLPHAHSCFNQIDLPEYSTKHMLAQRLFTALQEGSIGFFDR